MFSQSLLAAALEGLEMQKSRLDEQIALVRKMAGGSGAKRGPKPIAVLVIEESAARKRARKRELAEAREHIAAAERKRWAAFLGE